MRRWRLLLLGLLLVAGTVLVFAPASLLLSRIQAQVPGLQLSLVSGTIWHGGIADIDYRGRSLGALSWRVRTADLWHLRLAADFQGNGDWGVGQGLVWRDFERIGVENAQAQIAAAPLAGVFATPELDLLGGITVRIASAEIRGGALVALDGAAEWLDAGVAGVAHANLGTIRATLQLDAPNAVSATIADAGGPLAVEGGAWFSPLGYSADLQLGARQPSVRPALQWLGVSQAGGKRRLQAQGTWLGATQ